MKILTNHPEIRSFIFDICIVPIRFFSFWFRYCLRVLGLCGGKKYAALRSFRNKHNGEQCFIVGTGPSLKMDDLELIKNEYSFSVNSIVLSLTDTTWRPTYYAIQDKSGYERLKEKINNVQLPNIFIGFSDKTLSPKPIGIDYVPFPLFLIDHGKPGINHHNRFSNNAYKVVYDGHSITYSCIELAVYMGFKRIVLLGVDCDYSNKINHVVAYSQQTDVNAAFLMQESYKCARKYADKHDVEILNATRNAKMDVFKRVKLEDVIRQE